VGTPAAGRAAGTWTVAARPAAAVSSPLTPGVVIVLATALALALRIFQLSRPGHLIGFTQYDDGVYFGNALRLVNGAVPYRDFAMVQPPGSMLLMAPVALLAKVFGSAWGLAAARLLTVAADTANVALIGLLVRHRGSLAVGLACGGYAVYPAALNASQSLLLEPWLNLFCLLGALLVFQSSQLASPRRLAWGGAFFGFAAAIKIWAFAPALLAGGIGVRARRGRAWFAGGFVAGLAVPCLPFLALAPSGFTRTVFVSELIQATHGRVGAAPRMADITGFAGLSAVGVKLDLWAGIAVSAMILLLVATAWLLARRARSRPAALDWYALLGTVVVTAMMFSPSEWYQHYAAFAGPFVVLLLALSVARLAAVRRRPAGADRAGRSGWVATVVITLVLAFAAMAAADVVSARRLQPAEDLTAASVLIPHGACVLTDTVSVTIAIDRFTSASPGCPDLVDAVGTLIATTDGQDFNGSPLSRVADTRAWQAALSGAPYVWLVGNGGYTGARIVWTPALHAYFVSHFRLISMGSTFPGKRNIPRGGLYTRR
jgi:alpha-1,2-mannosyltransferase